MYEGLYSSQASYLFQKHLHTYLKYYLAYLLTKTNESDPT